MGSKTIRQVSINGESGVRSRPVKLDYSATYKDNDELDASLTYHLESLQKVHFRANKEKDDEIECVKKDAEKIQNLKECVNQRDATKEISNIFAKSNKESDEQGGNGMSNVETSRMMRRIQKEREKFSAKNHFNVILPKWTPQNISDFSDRKSFVPSSVQIQKPTAITLNGENGKQVRTKGYMQMTSSSIHRLQRPKSVPASFSSSRPYNNDITGNRSQSASRSRRELAELSRIELSWSEPQIITPDDQRQSYLLELKNHQRELQLRVNNFITDMDRFNRRKRKDYLAKYLDT